MRRSEPTWADPLKLKYRKGACLGEGSFGQVYEATVREQGPAEAAAAAAAALRPSAGTGGCARLACEDQKFALKFLEIHNVAEATAAVTETLRLVQCKHANIVGV